MTPFTVTITDATIVVHSQGFCGEFQNTDANQKALVIFFRELSCPGTGKPLFTYQQLADAFGKKDRRDIDNFEREFRRRGGDFLQYLTRKTTKKDRLFPDIERQILTAPLLGMAEQYRMFCEAHPQDQICEQTFRSYVNDIAVTKILHRVHRLEFKQEQAIDLRRYLQEVVEIDRLPRVKKKEIVETFPEVAASGAPSQESRPEVSSQSSWQKKVLVVVLYACALSQDVLALLFGVGKTSIHNWLYALCGEEVEWDILRAIVGWSGQVSFDEKWVRVKGQWWFVLGAVDAVSGFPLLMRLYPTLDTMSWTLFFLRFRALYGLPRQIQCDGSRALATAREVVFAGVRYQLCKFHKLKNLTTYLRHHIADAHLMTRCVRFARHMFTNTSVSSRKAAAKQLQTLAGAAVAAYLETHFLHPWRHLTLALTTNASERFNRKIEKCFSVRYGVSSEESAKVILRSLWLKELLLNGQSHRETTSPWQTLDLSKICQEHLDPEKILHFFHDHNPALIEKLA